MTNNISSLITYLNGLPNKNNKPKTELHKLYSDKVNNLDLNNFYIYSKSKLLDMTIFNMYIHEPLRSGQLILSHFSHMKKTIERFSSTNENNENKINAYCDNPVNMAKKSCICSVNLKHETNARTLIDEKYDTDYKAAETRYNNKLSEYNTNKASKQAEYDNYEAWYIQPREWPWWWMYPEQDGSKEICAYADKPPCDGEINESVNDKIRDRNPDFDVYIATKYDPDCNNSGPGRYGCRLRKRYSQSKIEELMKQWNYDNPYPTKSQSNYPPPQSKWAPKIQCCINSINTSYTNMTQVNQSCNQKIIEMTDAESGKPPTGSTQPPTGSTQPTTGSTQPPTGSKNTKLILIIISSIIGLSITIGISIYF